MVRRITKKLEPIITEGLSLFVDVSTFAESVIHEILVKTKQSSRTDRICIMGTPTFALEERGQM